MGLSIFLRKTSARNRFRDILIRSISQGIGDKAVLCSGFFQERNGYHASLESNFAGSVSRAKIELTTIGIHHPAWLPEYRLFVSNLRNAGANVIARLAPGFHWHAKIFLLKSGGIPQLGIIGSSNITRPAFSTTVPFNFEADVVMWRNGKAMDSFMRGTLEQIGDGHEVIVGSYNRTNNFGLTIRARLERLDKELAEAASEPLE